ncbi:(S)-2-haloacid dehalogenase [Colletotrichum liriopes]|uniref:(S)-2-haloacid dehalogenase n=1 Tax=Colletotrichum liriopes TaxID=708192 RepID=A0AA37LYX7_9PEZI|nr:(S)-2-haloacid dehalogenase [Colletotrichum liriopes]
MAPARPISSCTCLTFDCFGTLVDWESAVLAALSELTSQQDPSHPLHNNRSGAIELFAKLEGFLYSDFARDIGVEASAEGKKRFGTVLGESAAFPDTVAALQRLKRHFKLVILSNIDKASFSGTQSGPLREVEFDAVYTAQDIGSYKPDPRNFYYLVEHLAKDLGVSKDGIIHTAYSFPHDLVPARNIGIVGAWIERASGEAPAVMGGKLADVPEGLRPSWQFKSLGEKADAADADAAIVAG